MTRGESPVINEEIEQTALENKKEIVFINWNINYDSKIELLKNAPRVLGTETVWEMDGQYFLTPQTQQQHYAVTFYKAFFTRLNLTLNTLLNYFFH